MKKICCIMVLAFSLCLAACGSRILDSTDPTLNSEPTIANASEVSTMTTPPETTEPLPVESDQLPLPEDNVEFSFLSGAGAWRTVMMLNRDGTFTGEYLDSEMGEIGENYPHGSAYICSFSGKFADIEKLNEYSYEMTLTDIKTEKAVGEVWIEDNIRYVASGPYGLNDPIDEQECTEFILFLPDTPIDQVPEEFLSWWPYRYTQESPKTTLSCYGILNITTNFGFFTLE